MNSDESSLKEMEVFEKVLEYYEMYKRAYVEDITYPQGMIKFLYKCNFSEYSLDWKKKSKLHRIKISFATPTFDKIFKDKKVNFETILSSIGGTMGLLTGFSIISGIEILYFACKTVIRLIRKKPGTQHKGSGQCQFNC